MFLPAVGHRNREGLQAHLLSRDQSLRIQFYIPLELSELFFIRSFLLWNRRSPVLAHCSRPHIGFWRKVNLSEHVHRVLFAFVDLFLIVATLPEEH